MHVAVEIGTRDTERERETERQRDGEKGRVGERVGREKIWKGNDRDGL